jgi:hypothetical protein
VFVLGLVAATFGTCRAAAVVAGGTAGRGLVGELALFLTTALIVDRPRPPVPHLDAALPPTSSFQSGHTGAAICLYGGVALIIFVSTRSWVLGSVLLALPWLLMVPKVMRPRATPTRVDITLCRTDSPHVPRGDRADCPAGLTANRIPNAWRDCRCEAVRPVSPRSSAMVDERRTRISFGDPHLLW